MPRLPVVDPVSSTGRVREIFDGPLKGKHINIFKGLANSPAGLEAYLGLAGALAKGSLSHKEQEVVHLVISEANGCEYCLAAHTAIGKQHGLAESQTLDARRGRVQGDAKLDALAKFASALHERRGAVSDEDLRAFKDAGYTDGAVVDVIVTYTLAVMTNTFNILNRTDVDFPAPPALT